MRTGECITTGWTIHSQTASPSLKKKKKKKWVFLRHKLLMALIVSYIFMQTQTKTFRKHTQKRLEYTLNIFIPLFLQLWFILGLSPRLNSSPHPRYNANPLSTGFSGCEFCQSLSLRRARLGREGWAFRLKHQPEKRPTR